MAVGDVRELHPFVWTKDVAVRRVMAQAETVRVIEVTRVQIRIDEFGDDAFEVLCVRSMAPG
jgi:hypothetical protein